MVGHVWRVPSPLPTVRPSSAPADSSPVALVDPATGAAVGVGWLTPDAVWTDPDAGTGVVVNQRAYNALCGAAHLTDPLACYPASRGLEAADRAFRCPVVIVPSEALSSVAPALAALRAKCGPMVRVAPELSAAVEAVDLGAFDVPTVRARLSTIAPVGAPVAAPSTATGSDASRSRPEGPAAHPGPSPGPSVGWRPAAPPEPPPEAPPRLPRPVPVAGSGEGVSFGSAAGWLDLADVARMTGPRCVLASSHLPIGAVSLLAAAGSSGKTWVALSVAVALALADHPTAAHDPCGLIELRPLAPGCSVLALGDDDATGPQRRILAIVWAAIEARRGRVGPDAHPVDPSDRVLRSAWRYVTERVRILPGRGVGSTSLIERMGDRGSWHASERFGALSGAVADVGATLVVVDSVVHFACDSEADDQGLRAFYQACSGLASQAGAACMVLHHMRKRPSGDNVSSVSADDITGSSMHVNLSREVWTMERLGRVRPDLTDADAALRCLTTLRLGVKVNEGPTGHPPVWLALGPTGAPQVATDDLVKAATDALTADRRKGGEPPPADLQIASMGAGVIATADAATALAWVREHAPTFAAGSATAVRDRLTAAIADRATDLDRLTIADVKRAWSAARSDAAAVRMAALAPEHEAHDNGQTSLT